MAAAKPASKNSDRFRSASASRSPSANPNSFRTCAVRQARSWSSPYVRRRSPSTIATASGRSRACAAIPSPAMVTNDNQGVSGEGHGHSHASAGDLLREGSEAGIRSLRISALGLLLTSAIQFTVVAIGGSVALMADALHNLGDVLTSIVLWVALIATRRAADKSYTFGYQRFEDLAGLGVVLAIFASAAVAAYVAVTHLVDNTVPTHLALGMAAGGVGFAGNEIVAQIKVRQGKKIGSSALVAEGQHSRIDGLASLAAIAGLGGVLAGWRLADPIAGLVLVAVIVAVGVQAARPIV